MQREHKADERANLLQVLDGWWMLPLCVVEHKAALKL